MRTNRGTVARIIVVITSARSTRPDVEFAWKMSGGVVGGYGDRDG